MNNEQPTQPMSKEEYKFLRGMNELLEFLGPESDLMEAYNKMQAKQLPVSKRLRDYLAFYIESGMHERHQKEQEESNPITE